MATIVSFLLMDPSQGAFSYLSAGDLRQDAGGCEIEVMHLPAGAVQSVQTPAGSVIVLLDVTLIPAADLARVALELADAVLDDHTVAMGEVVAPRTGGWDLASEAWLAATSRRGTEIPLGGLDPRCLVLTRNAFARARAGIGDYVADSTRSPLSLSLKLRDASIVPYREPRLRAYLGRPISIREAVNALRDENERTLRLGLARSDLIGELNLPSIDAVHAQSEDRVARRVRHLAVAADELSRVDVRRFGDADEVDPGALDVLRDTSRRVITDLVHAARWHGWMRACAGDGSVTPPAGHVSPARAEEGIPAIATETDPAVPGEHDVCPELPDTAGSLDDGDAPDPAARAATTDDSDSGSAVTQNGAGDDDPDASNGSPDLDPFEAIVSSYAAGSTPLRHPSTVTATPRVDDAPAAAAPSTRRVVASLVIVTRNDAADLPRCLDAISRNTPEPIEVFVVDNASDDGCNEIANASPVVDTVIPLSDPVGYAEAATLASRRARASHIVFITADAIVAEGWLTPLCDATNDAVAVALPASLGLCGDQHAMRWIDDLRSLADPERLARELASVEAIETTGIIQPLAVSIRADVVRQNGLPDPAFQLASTVHLHLAYAIRQLGLEIVVVPRSYVGRAGGLRQVPATARELGLATPSPGTELSASERETMELVTTADRELLVDRVAGTPETRNSNVWGVNWSTLLPRGEALSVIIPVHDQLDHTRRCLDTLRGQHGVSDIEIIVFDNGSDAATREFLETRPEVRVIGSDTNVGFAAAVNRGMRAAKGRCLLILNNDVALPSRFLERLSAAVESNPAYAIVGAVANACAPPQRVAVPYTDLAGVEDFADERWAEHGSRVRRSPMVTGMAMLIRREVVDTIGEFDERFGIGGFEDTDFCTRAALAGFRAGIAEGVFLHHVGSATFQGSGVSPTEIMRANHARFLAKWRDVIGALGGSDVLAGASATGVAQPPERGSSPASAASSPAASSDWGWIPMIANESDPSLWDRPQERSETSSSDEATCAPTADDLHRLANTRLEEGRLEEARELFEWTLELMPEMVLAQMGLGLALCRLGAYEDAIAPLTRAIQLEPGFSEGYNNLGVAYYMAERPDEARHALERALELDPENEDARTNLASVLEEMRSISGRTLT